MAKPSLFEENVENTDSTELDDIDDEIEEEEQEEPETKETAKDEGKKEPKKSWVPDYSDEEEKPEEEEAKPEKGKAKEDKQEEEYDEIVYNKEHVKIPVSQRQTYLQKGYNYDKVNSRLNETNQTIREIENLSGMPIADVLTFMKSQKSQAEVQKLVDEKGYAEDDAKEIVRQREQARQETAKAQQIKAEAESTKAVETLKDKPYFSECKDEIQGLLSNTPGLDADTAYYYVVGKNAETLVKGEKAKVQKQTVADLADKSRRTVEVNSESRKAEEKLTPGQKRFAKIFGVPVKEVAKRI